MKEYFKYPTLTQILTTIGLTLIVIFSNWQTALGVLSCMMACIQHPKDNPPKEHD